MIHEKPNLVSRLQPNKTYPQEAEVRLFLLLFSLGQRRMHTIKAPRPIISCLLLSLVPPPLGYYSCELAYVTGITACFFPRCLHQKPRDMCSKIFHSCYEIIFIPSCAVSKQRCIIYLWLNSISLTKLTSWKNIFWNLL